MTDIFDKKTRSRIMSKIRGKNTTPERRINSFFARNKIKGYKRNYSKLPGSPDFVFLKKKIVVFYNSEFWHCRNLLKIVKMKPYWRKKLFRNFIRDIQANFKLFLRGYLVITIWGDEYKDDNILRKKICNIL
jgi:DNA mismatch endonuclease (patch repair protein)